MLQFTILPPSQIRRITASVGFVSPKDQPGVFVMVKNKRGWDIPGGHVEDAETPYESFERELREESACELLPGATIVALLESTQHPDTAIAVFSGYCAQKQFTPTDEIESVKFVSAQELLREYFGDTVLLGALLELLPTKS
ncbi:MAG TPA: NUDIX domain-containing protein [Candidatus Saccharimonadales bacterium]|nr:NUDIX domain-containing protein [Candidatus Saccharimonadales bacterium]